MVAMRSAIEATHNPTTQKGTGRDGNALVFSGGAGIIAGPDRARGPGMRLILSIRLLMKILFPTPRPARRLFRRGLARSKRLRLGGEVGDWLDPRSGGDEEEKQAARLWAGRHS